MRISVRVKPGTKGEERLEKQADESFVAYIHARAHDGEANKALLELVSDFFGVAKPQITIVSGAKARQKILEFFISSGK